mmetsp:Transcript_14259/g.24451  ORF Transcript_14259/g.24451 Transcript_14259/m.24451 type:complete len:258 (-) Transcript_14259:38-811(-)
MRRWRWPWPGAGRAILVRVQQLRYLDCSPSYCIILVLIKCRREIHIPNLLLITIIIIGIIMRRKGIGLVVRRERILLLRLLLWVVVYSKRRLRLSLSLPLSHLECTRSMGTLHRIERLHLLLLRLKLRESSLHPLHSLCALPTSYQKRMHRHLLRWHLLKRIRQGCLWYWMRHIRQITQPWRAIRTISTNGVASAIIGAGGPGSHPHAHCWAWYRSRPSSWNVVHLLVYLFFPCFPSPRWIEYLLGRSITSCDAIHE